IPRVSLVSSECHQATASCYYFGERRTDKSTSSKFQGIETPSQNRFVGYFAKVKNSFNMTLPLRKILTIKKIIIYSIHGKCFMDNWKIGQEGHCSYCWGRLSRRCVHTSPAHSCMVHDAETDRVIFNLLSCPPLYDEVKVKFLSSNLPKYYDNCPFFFWFHTSFIQNNRLYLPRSELDNPHKPRAWKIYRPDFAVEVHFDEVVAGI
uniref:C2 tensin-type domain-containing protein n=1 Tax=Sus scrofa TaxID=9823 RepID=A0A8D1FUX5_PIG